MFRWTLYPLGKLLLSIFLGVLGPLRVYGRKNVPRRGGLLVLANHISDADPPTMFLAVPRPVWFMAKSELFEIKIIKYVIRWYRSFPIERGTPDRGAIRKTVGLLQSGECVVMFPEGECSEDGLPLPLLPGAALIVRTSGAPVVCAGIRGTSKILPYGKVFPRPAFGGVSVTFGKPRHFEKGATQEEILDWIEQELARLRNS